MTRSYVLDGAWHELPDGSDMPKGAREVDRGPETGEYFDEALGGWVLDAELKIERETDLEAKKLAHAVKQAEAALVLSLAAAGIPMTAGLLYEEAEATGADIAELARGVLVNAAPAHDAEVARRVAKTKARKK